MTNVVDKVLLFRGRAECVIRLNGLSGIGDKEYHIGGFDDDLTCRKEY